MTLCDPMDCCKPGFPVHHQLPEPTQTHVHCIGDAIQPSHPLIPSSPALDFSQHQGLFLWVAYLYQWPKYRSFSVSPSIEYSGLISLKMDCFDILAVQGTFRSFSPVPQLEGSINSLVFCLLYHPALTTVHDHWEDHSLDCRDLCQQSNVSAF